MAASRGAPTVTRRRRRTRWLCELSRDGEAVTRQILAYNRESARAHYERMGYLVRSIEAHRPSKSWERPANKAWRKDERAIREAIEFFGLTLPVEIKLTSHAGGRFGAHSLMPVGGRVRIVGNRVHNISTATGIVHRITLKSWRSAEEASRTLWHELTHAMQAERALAKLTAPYTAHEALQAWGSCADLGKGVKYDRKPVEVEAREYESFHDEHPLTKELSQ